MWHVGIDLHRATVVLAAVNDAGEAMNPITIPCSDTAAIVSTVKSLESFRAVIEACGTYRWLYDLLRPHGTVLLAHPMRLRAMIQRRSKTDKLDAQLLANLLRINQIPLAYIPPEPCPSGKREKSFAAVGPRLVVAGMPAGRCRSLGRNRRQATSDVATRSACAGPQVPDRK
jgi:transposase